MTERDWMVIVGPSYGRNGFRSGLGGGDFAERWVQAQTVAMMITA